MERRLAAVLAADICDYSRLMGEDAEAMLGALRRLRSEVFGPAVASRRGRIVKNMGDGWIVLFGAASDAASCAIQIQDRLAVGSQPGEPEIRVRVGVHLGDVTEEDEDVFGDGVNVAARLEGATAPGSVAVSEAVFGSLDGTLRPAFDDAGTWQLKNIDRPVQVWTRGESASHSIAARDQADGLRIVVQPVVTSDDRAEVRELADAITGDVTTYLGAAMWMSATTAQDPGGAHYYQRLSLRSSGNRLRLEAQLLNASGAEVMKYKFDGDLSEVFDWQDSVAADLSGMVLQTIYDAEQARLSDIEEAAKSASDYILQACLAFENLDDEALQTTLDYASRAVELDPDRPSALLVALFAFNATVSVGLEEIWTNYSKQHAAWLESARPLWAKYPLIELSSLFVVADAEDFAGTIRATLDRVLRKGSLDYATLSTCGYAYTFLGMPDSALDCLHRALKLGQNTPWRLAILAGLGNAYLQAGQFEKTLELCRLVQDASPDYLAPYRQQAAAYAQLGDMTAARGAAAELLKRKPQFTISGLRGSSRYVDTPETQLYFDGLRMAGLPE